MLPKSFETLITSLWTQIMLPRQFVEPSEHFMILFEL
jgi:hypothetical protein